MCCAEFSNEEKQRTVPVVTQVILVIAKEIVALCGVMTN